MRFEADHEFPAGRAAVADVLCDPAFHTQLDLPDLSRPEVLESGVTGDARVLRLRYQYVGQIDGIARKIVGNRKLTWIQELRLDTSTFTGTLSFSAEEDPGKLNGEAKVALSDLDDGARTQRHITGDLHVKVPLVGGTAERRIVPGLVRRLDVEAENLAIEVSFAILMRLRTAALHRP